MGDSFDPPSGNFNLNASGQRVWIADYSGLPIETQLFGGERFVKAWISGQAVSTTVNIDLSGVSFASNVSGNIVYLTSGQNNVQMSGQTVYLASGFNEIAGSFTANVSGQPVNVSGNAVRVSGETVIALISGQTVVANVTTNISGQTVYLTSGQNNVQMSGQTVVVPFTSISGNVIVVPSTSVSGNAVAISGQVVYTVSGQNESLTYGFITASGQWGRMQITQSGQLISGIPHKVVVTFSGDSIIGSVSGNMVSVSGQPASVSGNMISISGQPVSVSGNLVTISGNIVNTSGQVSIISGQPVNASGNVVYLTSGQNDVAALGLIDASGQLTRLRVTQSGALISGIPHKLVVTFSGDSIIGSVSGNMVSISGQPTQISGQLVAVSGTVAASVSGNMVSISGQPVSVSGNVVVASVTTNISGQVVYTASGQNAVQLYALDLSGLELRPLIVNASGSNILRVDAGAIQVSANVSGNVVYLVSGQNNVQMSGQVVLISGQTVVASVTTNISGQTVYLASGQNAVQNSGQTIRNELFDQSGATWRPLTNLVSGANILAVGIASTVDGDASLGNTIARIEDSNIALLGARPSLSVLAQMYGFEPHTTNYQMPFVTASGKGVSGMHHKLVVTFSGDSIIGSVSGNMVSVSGQPASVSGQVVNVSGNLVSVSGLVATSVSGNMVSVSGQPVSVSGNMISISGQPAKVSGETVSVSGIVQPRVPVQIRTRDTLLIDGASGGIALLSGDVLRVTVRNIGISGTVMYVGGSGDYPWVASGQTYPMFSGHGFWLRDGDGITVHTSNMAFVRVVAHTSGQRVSYLGEQY